jgi:thioredoxin 1
MASEHVVELTDANFESEALQSELPVVVDLWAPWCGPCKMLTPIIEELAEEYEDKVKVTKVNVDESPQIASKFNVISIPTILFLKNGAISEQHVGLLAKEPLKAKFNALLD